MKLLRTLLLVLSMFCLDICYLVVRMVESSAFPSCPPCGFSFLCSYKVQHVFAVSVRYACFAAQLEIACNAMGK